MHINPRGSRSSLAIEVQSTLSEIWKPRGILYLDADMDWAHVQECSTFKLDSKSRGFAPVNHHHYFTMVTVAVAGGTGRLGRTIVDALRRSQNHEVIVLTRKVKINSIQQEYDTDR